MITVRDVYNAIDSLVPFSSAEEWDNCGILAGNPDGRVTKILTALDITVQTAQEAARRGAELVVSHHPVIFHPLKAVYSDSPVGILLSNGISAICTHTPFDMAECGMNKGLYDILKKPLGLKNPMPLEETGENSSIGMICDLEEPMLPVSTARILKEALGCGVVRYTDTQRRIGRTAICSGSGGSYWRLAQAKGADSLISGDFKHDVLIDAVNGNFTLFDCGHFHTERIFCGMMKKILSGKFTDIEVIEASSCVNPVDYIV